MMARGPQVKNTFIDIQASPVASPLPTPMASAPAQCTFSLKDSLARAADEELPQRAEEASAAPVLAARARIKPHPLNQLPAASMTVIPESPSGARILKECFTTVVSGGASSIPPTPAAVWEFMPTPTGTPLENLRTTLSLVDMIQSPQGITLHPAFQAYQGFPAARSAPPPYTPKVAAQSVAAQLPLQTARQVTVLQAQPAVVTSVATMAVTQPASSMSTQPAVVAAQPVPAAAHVPLPPAAAPPDEVQVRVQAAAVQLGLVPQATQQAARSSATVAVGTIRPQYAVVGQQVPGTNVIMAMYSQPQTQATVTSAQPQRFVPPPPLAPAPTLLLSPKASSAPMMRPAAAAPPSAAMPEADLKVLLDLAVSSKNQQAVDALQRTATQGGMSAERFRALLEESSALEPKQS